MTGVDERTADLAAAFSEAQQQLDHLEERIRALEGIKPSEDLPGYHRAQLDLHELRVRRFELADDAAVARLEYSTARTQVRREIKRALTPGRRKLIEKMHRALKVASEIRAEIDRFDDEAERLLGGVRLPVTGWPHGPEDIGDWFQRATNG